MTPAAVPTTIRVRYAETDAQGVVYHANYLVYCEVGRGAFLRAAGLDYNRMEAAGHFLVVVEANTRYVAPARYDDELVVTTSLEAVRTRSLIFRYVVTRGETRVAEGRTVHVCVGRDGKPTALPEAMRAQLAFEAR